MQRLKGSEAADSRRRQVWAQSVKKARTCLRNLAEGDTTSRELKSVIEDVLAPEYKGRVLVELLQNAHDAHPAKPGEGRVEILLDETEGEHGVLYVANGGRELTPKRFDALCRVASSSKRPDESIGHKGVGFKSVRQLTEAPELYSVSGPASKTFDGYCFRFARSSDFDRLAAEAAPDNPNAADRLRDNLSALTLPVPVDEIPEPVRQFCRRGIVTVVRLPLKDAEARASAARQLRELTDDSAPFELFLDRLAMVIVTHAEAGAAPKRVVFGRRVTTLFKTRGLRIEEVALRRGRLKLIMVRSRVPEERVLPAIAASGDMGKAWDRWRGSTEVMVAVPASKPLARGRLFTFLPMSATTECPVHGYVNAPFFAHVSRRSLAVETPWNQLLFDEVATACARVAVLVDKRRVQLPGEAVIDLVCRNAAELERLQEAFRKLDHKLNEVAFIPKVNPKGSRTSFDYGYLIEQPEGVEIFTPQAVGATGRAAVIDPALHPLRADRLRTMGRLLRLRLEPGTSQLAEWAEAVAEGLVAATGSREADHERWADFYHDLAVSFPDAAELRGKRIVLGVDGRLVPAGGEHVFFPDTGDALLQPDALPTRVREHLSFVHDAIPWSGVRGRARSRRAAGRRWLEQQGLVQTYTPAALLPVLTAVMRQDGQDDATRRECLHLACRLWIAQGPRTGRIKGMLVPTRGGWSPTRRAMFGPGWAGAASAVDETLVRFLDLTRTLDSSLRQAHEALLQSAAKVCDGSDIDPAVFQRFLEHQGVSHGLRPTYLGVTESVKGNQLNHPWSFDAYRSICRNLQAHRDWTATAENWRSRHGVLYSTVAYRPQSRQLAKLPGQDAYAEFSDESRRLYAELIVHGLEKWRDSALEARFVGGSDRSGTLWPTPLAAFLCQAPWIPQTLDHRGRSTFAPASTAWWWSESEQPPTYLSVVPAGLRQLATSKALERLDLLGVRRWSDPRTAFDRLRHLPQLLLDAPQLRHGAHTNGIRRTYERAWSELLPPHQGQDRLLTGGRPTELEALLVSRGGVLEVLPAAPDDEVAEPVYLPGPGSGQQRKLLDQVPVPMLPLDDRALGGRVREHLAGHDGFEARSCSDAVVQVVADQLPAPQAPSTPLLEFTGPWLRVLVAAVVEYDEDRALRPETVTVARLLRRLNSCSLVLATEAVTHVAGHALAAADRSVLHDDPERPCLVVVQAPLRADWPILQAAAPGIAELVGAPYLARELELALMRLGQQMQGQATTRVTAAALATALDLPLHRLEAVLSDRASARSGSARLVPVIACEDVELAEQLQQLQETFNSRAELRDWLAGKLGADGAELLLSLPEDDWQRLLLRLGVPLERANRAWEALGLTTIDNSDLHTRQFEAWLQGNRSHLVDQVRDAFAASHRAGRELGEYVRLRELPGLTPDPAWHRTLWELPVQLMADHADRWLAEHLPPAGKNLEVLLPVSEVRGVCVGFVHARLPELRSLVERWLTRQVSATESTCPGAAQVAREMEAEGLLDFAPLTRKALITWLHSRGHWPEGMPATTNLGDLGLERGQAGRQSSQQRDGKGAAPSRRSHAPTLEFNGEHLPIGSDDLRELARRVVADLSEAQLATPVDVVTPETPGPAAAVPRQRGSGGSGKGTGDAREAGNGEKPVAVGLAGEVAVGAWLERHFGVPPEESWKSEMRRHVLADGKGDNHLGYDFRIWDGERTLLFEVKSSTGADGEIHLGDTETKAARASQLDLDTEYRIVYVSHVNNHERRRITPLPNPFSESGLTGYQIVSTAMRLRFVVPQEE
ncbi:ATP-binding protein [Streptomyces halstedii]|uniref:ATP-binding protein n=1 Tax=Streptomyces halstedii TaxID=1944 RepID=A0A6N9UEI3_STRHA|nr:ATP-binding protein [Streptomyces halstedii]NEA20563.1 ATP-binding protein [Streptomyces halstedii]